MATRHDANLNKSDQQALEGFKGESQKPISKAEVEKLLQVLRSQLAWLAFPEKLRCLTFEISEISEISEMMDDALEESNRNYGQCANHLDQKRGFRAPLFFYGRRFIGKIKIKIPLDPIDPAICPRFQHIAVGGLGALWTARR